MRRAAWGLEHPNLRQGIKQRHSDSKSDHLSKKFGGSVWRLLFNLKWRVMQKPLASVGSDWYKVSSHHVQRLSIHSINCLINEQKWHKTTKFHWHAWEKGISDSKRCLLCIITKWCFWLGRHSKFINYSRQRCSVMVLFQSWARKNAPKFTIENRIDLSFGFKISLGVW